ncbi:MAG: MurT ligase domain-containing protein [Turicibacter sp.]|nr:MurT ligase domain-containing protein [Turicibacter sp.]
MLNVLGIATGKMAGTMSRMMGKNGENIPGHVATRFDKDTLKKLAGQVDKIILITGTNGKTTVSNLVGSVMKDVEPFYVNNLDGSNMMSGVLSAFIKRSNAFGQVRATHAILEVDEASLIHVLKHLTPDLICITNFFRDQLDRYAEIDALIQKLVEAIDPVQTQLLINGDDPFSYRFSQLDKEIHFFGCHEGAYEFEQSTMHDSKFCTCQREFSYDFIHYGQLGAYSCECGVKRPEPDFAVRKVTTDTGFSIFTNDGNYHTSLKGAYNAYNVIAAVAICKLMGIDEGLIQKGISSFHVNNGRMQTMLVGNVPFVINLVKNPQGLNSTLSTVVSEEAEKQVVLFLNDGFADGQDVSWIWDVDFEKLADANIQKFIVSGRRAYDLAIRLTHAGIAAGVIEVEQDISAAVLKSSLADIPTFLIPNYTCLAPVLKVVSENSEVFKTPFGNDAQPAGKMRRIMKWIKN